MKHLSQLCAILHDVSGLILLLFSGWFICACAIAGEDYANVNFNYLLPAVIIRALALTRIATGYAQMWIGHRALLAHVKSLRLTLFSRLKNKRLLRRAESTEALAKHTESIASLNMAWTMHAYGAIFMTLVATITLMVWLPKLLWLWMLFCVGGVIIFVRGFRHIQTLGEKVLALKTTFRHDSEHHLASAALWHLYPKLTHCDMRHLWAKQHEQDGIGERMLWWVQVIALVCLLILLGMKDYRGQSVLLVFILLLLSAKDWLGQIMRAQSAFADYQEGQRAFNELPAHDIVAIPSLPEAIDTLLLRDFLAVDRPIPPINLSLSKGDVLLLKGDSGSGKSSILQAIAGLLPHVGEKVVNGKPLDQGFIQNWHYADQTPVVLSASLATNLRLASAEANDVRLHDALKFADLAHLENLSEWLGAQGRQLSGGELKRLNVARAYLFDAALYLFDEPFEGLDDAKQQVIAACLNALAQRAPVIVASHIAPEGLTINHIISV